MQLVDLIINIDMAVFAFFGSVQSGFLTGLARFFSFDNTVYVVIGAAILAALCIIPRTRKIGFALVIAVLIGALLCNGVLKPLVQRPRPYILLQDNMEFMRWYSGAGMLTDKTFSFPSGHATAVASLMTVLFIAHLRSEKKAAKMIVWIFPVVALLSALSRVYLMIHYITDAAAGILVGILAGIAGCFLAGKIFQKAFGVKKSTAVKKQF